MRLGPATRAALLCEMSCCPSPCVRLGEVHAPSKLRGTSTETALARSSIAKRTPRINLQHYGRRRPVLPCVEDSVRRPQRQGNQCAETRSGGTLPAIHPRELPGTASSARNALAGHAEHLA